MRPAFPWVHFPDFEDLCGENGKFRTFVFDAPGLSRAADYNAQAFNGLPCRLM